MAEDVAPSSVSKFNQFKQRFEDTSVDKFQRRSSAGFKAPNGPAPTPSALKPRLTSQQTESEKSDESDKNNNAPCVKPKPKVPGKLNINSLFEGEKDKIEQLGTKPKPAAKPNVEGKPGVAKKPPVLSVKPSSDDDVKAEASDLKTKTLLSPPNKSPVFNRIAEELSQRKGEGLNLKPVSQQNGNHTELKSPTSQDKLPPSLKPKVPSGGGQTDFRKKLKSIDDSQKEPIKLPGSKPVEIISRVCDSKQFKKLKLLNRFAYGNAPEKPQKLTDIDINSIINKQNDAEEAMWGTEEIYDAVEELRDESTRQSRQSFRPVSEIKPMSEEEENEQEVYDDALSAAVPGVVQQIIQEEPTEIYDDCETVIPDDEPGEIYEDMDELVLSRFIMEKVRLPLENHRAKTHSLQALQHHILALLLSVDLPAEEQESEEQKAKREEKERKKKEKEEKEKEKEKKKEEKKREEEKRKKEEEEKRIKKLFKLTGSEEAVAKGTVKEDAKGSKIDLAVKAGQKISVMRMIDNPAGKFLCQNNDGKWGYVESKNFTIDEDTLKQVTETELIKAQSKSSIASGANIPPDDAESQEIYEDCIFEEK